ncbi:MAG TPA: DUF4838 domain-containing protein [Tepidisphaeraceae bacterium]|nr:DUF4838 domain-containing protein [Tepidisphaeraceae bacterium]
MPHLYLLVALILTARSSHAAPLQLATDGRAAHPIVVSPKATDALRATAKELARYLGQITGATFEIKEGDGSAGIVLGAIADFPDPALGPALTLKNTVDGREAFAIRTEPGRVRLIGRTDLAASHAAFRLLEHFGCRWFFPAKEWEVVPRSPTLTVELNVDDRPKILSRRIWYGYGYFTDAPPNQRKCQDDYIAWARHNRMASSLPIHAGHAWQNIIHNNKGRFENHPEYLALTKGKRQGEMLCVTNADVRQLAVDYALAQLEKKPDLEMVSMECSDGGGHCECDNCKKLGGPSNQVFDLANHVARAVAEKYPGKFVGCLAYNEHAEPPTFDLEPNVYVQMTAGFIQGRYTYDELLELWPKKCKNLGFYEYFSVWLWDFDRLPGGRGADVATIAKQIRRYAAIGATSMDAESGDNWGPHGRGYYVANKLLWSPDSDVDHILADFYEKAFGPAAPAMKRYYERVEPARFREDDDPAAKAPPARGPDDAFFRGHPSAADRIFSRHTLALAYRDLAEATALAKDRPDVLARLDHLKQYLRFNHLCWLRDRETDKAKKKGLALAVVKHAYRTRHSYMNHWQAIYASYVPKITKDFDEPTWDPKDKTRPKAWQDAAPVTREETEADFRAGLADFVPQPVDERAFSSDVVPAKLPVADSKFKPAASTQAYQGAARYALYATDSLTIPIDVTVGTIAWYRNRPDARYALTDSAGKTVAEARLKLTGEPVHLDLKVPTPGLYHFTMNDSGAAWRITAPAGQPATILLPRGKKLSHQGHMQRMFFYVPKGTKTLHYFWAGGPHTLLGPDGKPIADVKTSGDHVSIDVPPGADGQCWSFTKLALGHLYFFNAPNVLAASPQALLLPKELVETDNLK